MVHFLLTLLTGIFCFALMLAYIYGCYRLSSRLNGRPDVDATGTILLMFAFPLFTSALYYLGDSILKVVFP